MQRRTVVDVYYHNLNDICVLKLNETVKFTDKIKSRRLAYNKPPNGSMVRFTGWGRTSFNNPDNNILMKTLFKIIDKNECMRLYTASQVNPIPRLTEFNYCGISNTSNICQVIEIIIHSILDNILLLIIAHTKCQYIFHLSILSLISLDKTG